MQEIAILLSSIAGACTAAAVKKFPKNKTELVSIGTSPQIKNQINSLRMEKEILTKTITRLYEHDAGLTKIQRDKLLLRYQHQLGIILAKIEKLEAASKHPDMGPIGDGLITLMDQKLSQLDNRLYELSSKIAIANVQTPEVKKQTEKIKEKPKVAEEKQVSEVKEEEIEVKPKEIEKQKKIIPDELPKPIQRKPVELTTLTELSNRPTEFPLIETKRAEPKIEIINEIVKTQEKPREQIQVSKKIEDFAQFNKSELQPELPKIESIPQFPKPEELQKPDEIKNKSTVKLPDDDKLDDDEDDLDKIKGEIMKTLSKLEQAEVE